VLVKGGKQGEAGWVELGLIEPRQGCESIARMKNKTILYGRLDMTAEASLGSPALCRYGYIQIMA
jgi:hypothetical protein